MKEGPDIARIAMLIGDPARANMLTALMAGKALTATELAAEAGITAQTASSHLARLEDGGLIAQRRQGRHKYVTLAGEEVAHVLEALMGLAAGSGHLRTRTGPRDAALRKARVCYNHLAGDLGIRLFDSLTARGMIVVTDEDVRLTAEGAALMEGFGIDLAALRKGRAVMCRCCLDWSERRSHLAGSLGRALLSRIEALGWARRDPGTRAVLFTKTGEAAFLRELAPLPA
ncbi:helix-turn-helix transcriptional regulator [Pararhodobacter sp. CCB-MM2]|uniref:ArsR/SmtB family transcription factor n=1 Tax=Pararhodobacter sp. CCB-MM2 TaxID=1786003 RepID=UPI0008320EC1|nr:winged helix-turn-helix domain-containing protein [Pararhodobacter sp. CCB-MM2]